MFGYSPVPKRRESLIIPVPVRQRFYCEKLCSMVTLCRLTNCALYDQCHKNTKTLQMGYS